MRRTTLRVSLVLLGVAALLIGSASAFAAPKDQGCHQTPNSENGNGANKSGPYDDTCVPAPSLNGNGNGNATGKPCAGCVGNADEKNPPGQLPGPQDGNNGYECDGNNGIAKTNPAHTGCTTPPPPPCTENCGECTENCGGTPPPGTEVLGKRVTKVAGESLAKTGPVDLRMLIALAGAFIMVGWSLTRVSAVPARSK